SVAEPVIHDYGNIECRDAVLAYDRMDHVLDAGGKAVARWDGVHFKPHPVTGEQVPDEAFQTALEKYLNPRKAEWPAVDFIVGNPPFIGNKRMRDALGDGYVEALRGAWHDVPDSADFVMYWWHRAAGLVREGGARQFGLITTNSLRQTFNRRVIERHFSGVPTLHLAFAVPDHPWVDNVLGAAVRISMSVGAVSARAGELLTVIGERPNGIEETQVECTSQMGIITADLRIGADVAGAVRLQSNARICWQGVKLVGDGFLVAPNAAVEMRGHGEAVVRPYLSNKDLVQTARHLSVIDFNGRSMEAARAANPAAFQQVLDRVKPLRDQNREPSRKERWWLFGRSNENMRDAISELTCFVVTPEVAKHRPFVPVTSLVPDASLYVLAVDDLFLLGCMSSSVHLSWALIAGGRMGVGNDPRYNNRCFETFPFPANDSGTDRALAERIRRLAEQIDAHRKKQQAAHQGLTLTSIYNVLEKLKLGETLNEREKIVHEHGLVSVLKTLHGDLDEAVLAAYGWSDLVLPRDEEELLLRLVALNAERAAEEARGTVRWLRPEFQDPARRGAAALPTATQDALDLGTDDAPVPAKKKPGKAAKPVAAPMRRPWPNTLPEQMRGVAGVLTAHARPIDTSVIEATFTGRGPWKRRIPQILEALAALGRARVVNGLWTLG
ncbi:MAG: type IIL restriction-modification enzyme MmeI, partial [Casimicrobiaceae bacterium]